MSQPVNELAKAIIGELMIASVSVAREQLGRLRLGDFDPDERIVLATMMDLVTSGKDPDIVSVVEELTKKGLIYNVGTGQGISRATLVEYQEDTYSTAHLEQHISQFIERNTRSKLHQKFAMSAEYAMNCPLDELLAFIKSSHESLTQLAIGENSLVFPSSLAERRASAIKTYLSSEKVGTGFKTLDSSLTYGLAPKMISTTAARPGQGKSTLKSNMINNLCEQGYGCFNVNTEQSEFVEQNRFDAIRTGIPLTEIIRMHNWAKGEERFEKLVQNAEYMAKNWNYYTLTNQEMTVDLLETFIKKIRDAGKRLDVVFVDLLDRFADIDMDSVGVVHKKLKQLDRIAKSEAVHINVLCQLRRIVPDGKKVDMFPKKEQIKWASTFEEVSRLIMLIYREAQYKKDLPNNRMDVIIAKQNDGMSGDYLIRSLAFDPDYLILFDEKDEDGKATPDSEMTGLENIPPQDSDDESVSFDKFL